ncbi:MAG: TetR/AcrR family transcriptional regulator [Acidimicrobiales bacterium]
MAAVLETAGGESQGEAEERSSRRPPGRRDELLAAALDVIRRVGPSASMEQMAAEAGITKPVLYRYFSDRDGLIAAVATRFSSVLAERLGRVLARAPGQGAEATIRAAIECYVGFIEEDPALYAFLTQQAAPASPALVAVIDRVAGPITETIRDALAAAGLDTSPAVTWAYGIVGMVHLAGARWARLPDMPRGQLIDDLVALAAQGLARGLAGVVTADADT